MKVVFLRIDIYMSVKIIKTYKKLIIIEWLLGSCSNCVPFSRTGGLKYKIEQMIFRLRPAHTSFCNRVVYTFLGSVGTKLLPQPCYMYFSDNWEIVSKKPCFPIEESSRLVTNRWTNPSALFTILSFTLKLYWKPIMTSSQSVKLHNVYTHPIDSPIHV